MVLAPVHSTMAKQKTTEGTDTNADACKPLPTCHNTMEYLETHSHFLMVPLMPHGTVKSLTNAWLKSLKTSTKKFLYKYI
jgi:hypothetical protein